MAEENGEEASGGGGGRGIIITEEISDEHLLLSILLLLPLESILCFGMSCKKIMALTRSHTLWKSLCNRDYNHHSTDSNSDAGVVDWYRLYHRLRHGFTYNYYYYYY